MVVAGAEDPASRGTASRWPAWFAPAGFLIGLGLTLLLGTLVSAGAVVFGGDADSPTTRAVSTVLQGAAFVGTAYALASRVGRPSLDDFGLRRVAAATAIGMTLSALVLFYGVSAVYAALVEPQGEQDVLEQLGADRSTQHLFLTGVVVLVVAPFAEEIFFRGFFYRALRNRFPTLVAAALVGLLFGAIHYTGSGTLDLLPVLAFLGIVFCLLYEWSGSLYPSIALHAVNNTLAFLVTAEAPGAEVIALVLGGSSLLACVLLPRWQRTAET